MRAAVMGQGLRAAFPMANNKLTAVVNQINAKVQLGNINKGSFPFSQKLRQLREQQVPVDGKLDFANSPMVGTRSAAEWAGLAMSNQRNALSSLSHSLDYQREKLTSTIEKIESFEKSAAGEFSQKDLDWIAFNQKNISKAVDWAAVRKNDATLMAGKYKERLQADYGQFMKNHLAFYKGFTKVYDTFSGGQGSALMADTLTDISPAGLGLTNLDADPAKIMDALNGAQQKLNNAVKALEKIYQNATGKPMLKNNFSANTDTWKQHITMENAFLEARDISETLVGEKARKGNVLI